MSGITDLDELLRTMEPLHVPGEYTFVTVPSLADLPGDVMVHATVLEPEGTSVVVSVDDARAMGATVDFVGSWITLQVHSALEAVGLTAAVSAALTAEGISCNVIAGHHHDHLLVPTSRLDDALSALRALSSAAG